MQAWELGRYGWGGPVSYSIHLNDQLGTSAADWSASSERVQILFQKLRIPVFCYLLRKKRIVAQLRILRRTTPAPATLKVLFAVSGMGSAVCGGTADSRFRKLSINRYFYNHLGRVNNLLGIGA